MPNPNVVLDGELYNHDLKDNFEKIVSLVRKTKPTAADLEESKQLVQYHVYDCLIDDVFYVRNNILENWVDGFFEHVHLVKTVPIHDEHDIVTMLGRYLEQGYEGQMLRLDEAYENKRSKFLLKHKSFQDEEFTIIDIVEGEGNRTGSAGYFVFETSDGKPFKSNVKGTYEETSDMLKNRKKLIGKQATVKYFNLTPDGIPRFPYVIAIDRQSYEGK